MFIHNIDYLHFTRASCRKSSSISPTVRPFVRSSNSTKCKVSLCKCCWHGTLGKSRPTNVCQRTHNIPPHERACGYIQNITDLTFTWTIDAQNETHIKIHNRSKYTTIVAKLFLVDDYWWHAFWENGDSRYRCVWKISGMPNRFSENKYNKKKLGKAWRIDKIYTEIIQAIISSNWIMLSEKFHFHFSDLRHTLLKKAIRSEKRNFL